MVVVFTVADQVCKFVEGGEILPLYGVVGVHNDDRTPRFGISRKTTHAVRQERDDNLEAFIL